MKTRISLIHPHGCAMNTFLPLSLAYLKSCLNDSEFDVKIIDCTLKDIPSESDEFKKILLDYNPNQQAEDNALLEKLFNEIPIKETNDLTDSIKALRDSAKKLNFRS